MLPYRYRETIYVIKQDRIGEHTHAFITSLNSLGAHVLLIDDDNSNSKWKTTQKTDQKFSLAPMKQVKNRECLSVSREDSLRRILNPKKYQAAIKYSKPWNLTGKVGVCTEVDVRGGYVHVEEMFKDRDRGPIMSQKRPTDSVLKDRDRGPVDLNSPHSLTTRNEIQLCDCIKAEFPPVKPHKDPISVLAFILRALLL